MGYHPDWLWFTYSDDGATSATVNFASKKTGDWTQMRLVIEHRVRVIDGVGDSIQIDLVTGH